MVKNNLEKLINETVDQILEKFVGPRSDELHVYDFDDTLVRTDSTIFVVNTQTSERRELHPHEFHEYHLDQDEQFDLTNFHAVENPTLLPHFEKLKSDYARLGPNGVAILTARPEAAGVQRFLKKHGMGNIVVAAVGIDNPTMDVRDMNADKKRKWLKVQLDNRPIGLLSFYDDNDANISAAQSLQGDYPDVRFNIELV